MTPRILLLMNDPELRRALIVALRSAGMNTTMTGDAMDARAILLRDRPDLAIVDAKVPDWTGREWVEACRRDGITTPMILCCATDADVTATLPLAGSLGMWSVVNRAVPAAALAHHVSDLFAAATAHPVPDVLDVAAVSDELPRAVEALRVSLVALQQNPEKRERIETTLGVARKLAAAAKALSAAPVLSGAEKIAEILAEAMDGRRRIDGSAFSEMERFLIRARDAAPQFGAVRASPDRPASASAHTRDEVEVVPEGGDPETDPLTGLFTREAFLHHAGELVSEAMISDRPLSIVVIVISGLDALRASGLTDSALRETGKFLSSRFRPVDRRGRYEVHEFGLALPGMPVKMAADLMTRTIEAFGQVRLPGIPPGAVSMCAGVVAFPKEARDAETLLAAAFGLAGVAAKTGGGVRSR